MQIGEKIYSIYICTYLSAMTKDDLCGGYITCPKRKHIFMHLYLNVY